MSKTSGGNNTDVTGVLLLNLGGPDSLKAVRPFLFNLFSDREIIRLGPSFLQKPLAKLISGLRSSKSRGMYAMIGGASPILQITKAQAEALEISLNSSPIIHHLSSSFKVYVGMRYWHPYIKDTVDEIIHDGISSLVVLFLYPQYSKTTTGSSIAEFRRAASGTALIIKYIERWHDFPPYIDALSELVYEGIKEFGGEAPLLLYSAHSIPESFIIEGDPYFEHTKETVSAVNRRLSEEPYNMKGFEWRLSFQSRSGPVKWLEPPTGDTIVKLGREGHKKILVIPVSFVSDHIETLYEIGMLFRELAARHGITLRRCRSLNTSERFITALRDLVLGKMGEER
ncbi:MAG: ferrochelatase [Nitrospirae bacterium]|nr:ferrochelatase [Nitrospirota bacterium]